MSLRTSIRRDTCLCWCRDSKELSIVFSTNWPKIRNIKLPWRNSHAKAWLQNSPLYAWTVLLLESGQRWFETMDFMWFLSCQFQLRIPEAEIYIGDQISFKSFLLANLQETSTSIVIDLLIIFSCLCVDFAELMISLGKYVSKQQQKISHQCKVSKGPKDHRQSCIHELSRGR